MLMYLTEYYPIFLKGLFNTVIICFQSLLYGLLIGIIVCAAKLSFVRLFRWLANFYIEVIRCTPFLVQVFLVYYVGPVFGLKLSAFLSGIICMSIYGSAYFAEIYRSGLQSIPNGQIEAAKVLGLSRLQILTRIVLPQMMTLILPMLANQMIVLVKESSVLSVITVYELSFAAVKVIGETFKYVEVYVIIALMYWGVNASLALLAAKLESFFSKHLYARNE
jgi:polar amino acid transport system permease protein